MPLTSYQAEVALETLSRYSRQLDESVDTPLKALVLGKLVQEHAHRRIQQLLEHVQGRGAAAAMAAAAAQRAQPAASASSPAAMS